MSDSLFKGGMVRLVAANAETDAAEFARWSRDSEYQRLLDTDPARPQSVKQAKEGIQQWMEHDKPDSIAFAIRTLDGDHLIGGIELDGIDWANGDAFMGIGIGDREYWDKGYGTDAMRVLLRYAFNELNLHRVTLDVFGYNPRALRSYEKVGFSVEGRARRFLLRDGQRWDLIYMGILREEWERHNGV